MLLHHIQVMGCGVGGRLRGQDHQLGRGVLGQRQDWLQRTWHRGGEAWRQILVQGCVTDTCIGVSCHP